MVAVVSSVVVNIELSVVFVFLLQFFVGFVTGIFQLLVGANAFCDDGVQ